MKTSRFRAQGLSLDANTRRSEHGTDAGFAKKALLCGDFWGYSSKTVGGCRKTTLISCVDDLLRQDYLVKKS